jgi:hypothetical protein
MAKGSFAEKAGYPCPGARQGLRAAGRQAIAEALQGRVGRGSPGVRVANRGPNGRVRA